MIARRTFMKRDSMASGGFAIIPGTGCAQQVPNSSGTEPAKLKTPGRRMRLPPSQFYDALRFPPVQPGGTIIPDASLGRIPNVAAQDLNESQRRGDALGLPYRDT